MFGQDMPEARTADATSVRGRPRWKRASASMGGGAEEEAWVSCVVSVERALGPWVRNE